MTKTGSRLSGMRSVNYKLLELLKERLKSFLNFVNHLNFSSHFHEFLNSMSLGPKEGGRY